MSHHAAVLAALGACVMLAGCAPATDKAQVQDPRVGQFAQLPDWRGIWALEGLDPGIAGFPERVQGGAMPPYALAGFDAPWNEAGRKKFQAMLADMGHRKADGWGYPMMMSSPAPFQFFISPEETLIINQYREVRHIRTDGSDHPPLEDRWDTTWGDSVGHWEGDTLVIDTVSVREPIKYFLLVPPLSAHAHYVERLRKTGPDRIESEVTIEDPENLTATWVARVAYARQPALDHLVHDDFTNDRSEVENGVFAILPPKQE
jgi:hypothetical protein